MPHILVTNDDGVRSEGLHVLAAALERLGDVTIVAPHTESSAIGHALTLRRPLRMDHVRDRVYEVDGTPTDCVNIAVSQIYKVLPDLVVSGINTGYNLGELTYSGIVAGAMKRAPRASPSIAVSLERTRGRMTGPPAGGRRRRRPAGAGRGLPSGVQLFNVPPGRPKAAPHGPAKRNHDCRRRAGDPRQAALLDREGQNDWEAHDRRLPGGQDARVGDAAAPDLTAREALGQWVSSASRRFHPHRAPRSRGRVPSPSLPVTTSLGESGMTRQIFACRSRP